MTDQRNDNTPEVAIWKSQRREHTAMSVEEIRFRVWTVQWKIRRNLVRASVLGILFLILCAIAFVNVPYTGARVILGAMMLLTIPIAYRARRRLWPLHQFSGDTALKGCLEFYRTELEAQHRSRLLTWTFLVPIVVFSFYELRTVVSANPTVWRIVFSALLIAILILRRLETRRLRRELDSLEEPANSA
jgi:membrane protein YdbS with pleckstrin-like domain